MKRPFFAILLFIVFSQCKETVEEPISLDVHLKGIITPVGEFGTMLEDETENIKISAENTDPLISSMTDSAGGYELHLTTGTYNLMTSKEGFGDNFYTGIKLIGGEAPYYAKLHVYQKSTTRVDDLEMVFFNNQLEIEGVATHNYPYDSGHPYTYVKCILFLSDSPEVSSSNYKMAQTWNIDSKSGEIFNTNFYISNNIFPSGTKIYAVVHGISYSDWGYDDADGNRIYSSIGDIPSNVASVSIP